MILNRILGFFVEDWQYRRRRRSKLSLKPDDGYRSSNDVGCEYKLLVRNDGGSIARDVVVRLLLDGAAVGESQPFNVPAEGEEKTRLRVPVARCEDRGPGVGFRAVGSLSWEAEHEGRVVASADAAAN